MLNRRMTDLPRGFRNHNPGNIDYNLRNKWQGLDDPPLEIQTKTSGKPRFCRFKAAKWGIRAIARTIITYYDKTKDSQNPIDTISEVINRWAPAIENHTIAYIQSVDRSHPKRATETLDFHSYEDLMPLVKGIINHELGDPRRYGKSEWYTQAEIDEGLRLAGVVRARPKPIIKSTTIQGSSAGLVSGAGIGTLTVVEAAREAQNLVQPGTIIAIILAAIIVGSSLWVIYNRMKRRNLEGT